MYETQTRQSIATARGRTIGDLLRLPMQRMPDKTALIYESHSDSFRELDEHINRAANALLAAGVKEGDRVAFLSHNNRSFVILRFAVIRASAVFTPINFMLKAAELAYILEHSEASAIIAEDALCKVAEQAMAMIAAPPRLQAYIRQQGVPPLDGWIDADAWLLHPDRSTVVSRRDEDDPAQMIYTSGTESRPKGVLLSSRALFAQYVTCIIDGGMDCDDIELHCMPLYHCAQLDCFLSVDLFLGAASILLSSAAPGPLLEIIEREKVTKLFLPPTSWIALLRHPDFATRDLSSLTKGYYGASIMPIAIIKELSRRLPKLRLWNFYGQTELAPVAAILKPQDQLRKLGSAGLPGINVQTRIFDEDDTEIERGMTGEIVHRSPQAMLGYFKDEEKTREIFRNGWMHSGDLGYMDDEGYLYVVDRKKDMIKSGGENIASREVEEVLFAHPKIAEAAVFGVPHPHWIEAVVAVIVLNADASLTVEEIDLFCRERLAGYKCPKHVHLINAIPKNASGKILKRELRAHYSAS